MPQVIETFELSYGSAGQAAGTITQTASQITLTGAGSNRTIYTIDKSAGSDFLRGLITIKDRTTLRYPMFQAGVGTRDASGTYQNPAVAPATLVSSTIIQGDLVVTYTDQIGTKTRTRTHTFSVVGDAIKIRIQGDGSTEYLENYAGAYCGSFSGSFLQILEGPGTLANPTAYITNVATAETAFLSHFLDPSKSNAQEYTITDPATLSLSATWSTLSNYKKNTAGVLPAGLGETIWCITSTDQSATFLHPNAASDRHAEVARGPWCLLTGKGTGGWAGKEAKIAAAAAVWGFDSMAIYPHFWWAKGPFWSGSQDNASDFQPGDPIGQASFGLAARAAGFDVGVYTYATLETENTGTPAGTLRPSTYDPTARVLEDTGAPRPSIWTTATRHDADTLTAAAGQDSSAATPAIAIASSLEAAFEFRIFIKKEATAITEARIVPELRSNAALREQFSAYIDTSTGAVRSVELVTTGGPGYDASDVVVYDLATDGYWLVVCTLRDYADNANRATLIVGPYETGGTKVGSRSLVSWGAGIVTESGQNVLPQVNWSDLSTWNLANGATITLSTDDEPTNHGWMRKTELVAGKFAAQFSALVADLHLNMVRFDVDTYAGPNSAGGDYVDADATSSSQTLATAIQERRRWMYANRDLINPAGYAFGEGGRVNHLSDLSILWAGCMDSPHNYANTNAKYDELDPLFPEAKTISNWPAMMEHEWTAVRPYFQPTEPNPARIFTQWDSGLQTTPPGAGAIFPFSRAMMDRIRALSFLYCRAGSLSLTDDWTEKMAEREVVKTYYLTNAAARASISQLAASPTILYHDESLDIFETENARFSRHELAGAGLGRASFVLPRISIQVGTVQIYVNRGATPWTIPGIFDGPGITLPTDGFFLSNSDDYFGSFESNLTAGNRIDVANVAGEYFLLDGRGVPVTFQGVTSPDGRLYMEHTAGGFALLELATEEVVRVALATSTTGAPVEHLEHVDSGAVVDIGMSFGTYAADLDFERGDLKRETGLRTAILVSLFSDGRAPIDIRPLPDGSDDPRGYWAEEAGDRFGSLLWLEARGKVSDSTAEAMRQAAEDALGWLVAEGIASSVTVSAERFSGASPRIELAVRIERSSSSRWAQVWESIKGTAFNRDGLLVTIEV